MGRIHWSSLLLIGSFFVLYDSGPAQAQGNTAEPGRESWFVKLDLTGVILNAAGTVSVHGTPIPGGSVSLDNSLTVSGDVGYFVTPNFALDVGFGYPPKTAVRGTGTLSFVGVGATSHYAPITMMIQYYLNSWGPVHPFIGIGPSYLVFLNVESQAIHSAQVKNAWGLAMQGGLDFDISKTWGINFDILQVISSTTASGVLAGTPATAKVQVNPLIIRGGLTYRF
jgi:outer membrane protein